MPKPPDVNELLEAVRNAGAQLESPPATEGWLSIVEIRRQLGISRNAALDRMKKLLAEGKVEYVKARQRGCGGTMSYWRLTNGKHVPPAP